MTLKTGAHNEHEVLGDEDDFGDHDDDDNEECLYTWKKEDIVEDRERTYASSNKLQKTPQCSVVCLVRYV